MSQLIIRDIILHIKNNLGLFSHFDDNVIGMIKYPHWSNLDPIPVTYFNYNILYIIYIYVYGYKNIKLQIIYSR